MMKHTKISSINRTQKGHTSFNKILVAAATCISEIGIEKTSVTAIAKKAEVSRALVAHYFPKKSELFAEVIKYIAQEAYTKIESTEENLTPQSALQKYANANFIFFLENPVFFKCFLLFYYYAAISKEFRKMNDKFNERAISRFEKELKKLEVPAKDLRAMAEALHGFIIISIEKFYIVEHGHSPHAYFQRKDREFAELLSKYITNHNC